MWTCPKCKRVFKRVDQGHYCIKPVTVEDYILACDSHKQDALFRIRDILRKALKDTDEIISWSMPTYYKDGNIIHFAASKNHIGLYPGEKAVDHFTKELSSYKTNKGTIQIPYDNIDEQLITSIALWCLENHGS